MKTPDSRVTERRRVRDFLREWGLHNVQGVDPMTNLHLHLRISLILSFTIFSALFLFHIPAVASDQVTLTWDQGSESDLAGYKVYFGTSSGTYSLPTDVGLTNQHTVPNLTEGMTYYFAVTAYDTAGNESLPSNEVSAFLEAPSQRTLNVTKVGSGTGTITGAGISCGGDCSHTYTNGTSVTLTANGSAFHSWHGCTSTSGTQCTVSMTANRTISATFFSTSPLIDQSGWSVAYMDSEERGAGGYLATQAIDGLATTFWHTQFTPTSPEYPHDLIVDLGTIYSIEGFRQLPRQDGGVNGRIGQYEFYVKTDSGTAPTAPPIVGEWTQVAAGTFSNTAAEQEVLFATNDSRYVWLRAVNEAQGVGNPWIALAELNVLGTLTTPAPVQRTLTVTKSGSGNGTVTGAGIACGSDCAHIVTDGTNITLTATGSDFNSWSGCTSTSGTQCTVSMTANRTVIATFTSPIAPVLTSPTLGSTLSSSTVTFQWSPGTGVDAYHLGVGTSEAVISTGHPWGDIFGANTGTKTSAVVSDIPIGGNPVYVRLWWRNGASWSSSTYTYQTVNVQRTLTVTKAGTGSGTITGPGITCGNDCSHTVTDGTSVTLTASGSDFNSWSGCSSASGTQCTVSMTSDRTVLATFSPGLGAIIHSVVSPNNRSVRVGELATAFASLTNTGTTKAVGCSISPLTSIPNTNFLYAPVDSVTNALSGPANTPVDIPVGTTQRFNITFVPRVAFDPINVHFNFTCTNASLKSIDSGLSTLLLSATQAPVADIVALTSAPQGKLTLHSSTATGAFLVASLNLGASDQITMSADTGDIALPVGLLVCEFDVSRGTCLAPPHPSTQRNIPRGKTSFYAVFVVGQGKSIALNPATTRVFLRFRDSNNVVRGLTSVTVQTP